MTHLSDEALRRHVDDPQSLPAAEKEHMLACRDCRARSDDIAANAAFAERALAEPPVALDLERARRAIAARERELPPAASVARIRWAPQTRWAVGLAAAAVLALGIFSAPVRSVAENFLAIFEPHNFQPIALTSADLNQLKAFPDLDAFGTVRTPLGGTREMHAAYANSAEAGRAAQQVVLRPRYLPPQVPNEATFAVIAPHDAEFTFSAAKARAAAARSGAQIPPMPPNLDGSTLHLAMGATVTSFYGTNVTDGRRIPQRAATVTTGASPHVRLKMHFHGMRGMHGMLNGVVFVVQAPAPRLYSTGASVREITDYLLAQPGISQNLAAQIRAIGDPSTTLPIPVPITKALAAPVLVQGVQGLAVGDETGVGGGVMWQRGGMVYAVAGPLRESELLAVANSLAP